VNGLELVEDRVDLAAVAENCAVLLQDMAADGGDRRTLEHRPTLRDLFAQDLSGHFSVWKPNFRGRNTRKLRPDFIANALRLLCDY
jgi:hypothetical protein